MVTPSLVITGPPNDFSKITLRPLGPMVTLTASPKALTPLRIHARASSENCNSLAIGFLSFIQIRLKCRRDEQSGGQPHQL